MNPSPLQAAGYPAKRDKFFRAFMSDGHRTILAQNNAFDKIRMSLGGWKTVYVVEPKGNYDKWFYAFYETGAVLMERCSIVLEGPIRLLTGPHDFLAFALDKNGDELPIKIHLQALRSDKTHKHHPIV